MRIYLAGGMKSGWQEIVKQAVPEFTYIDPSQHGLNDPIEYTAWDLAGVREADLIFAYMESSNPSGIGMAFEVGYAQALGKPCIFVDEKIDTRYFDMLRVTCFTVPTLEDGIALLKKGRQDDI